MKESEAVTALAALGHPHRLRLFRLLVVAGPSGVPAGEIAEELGVAPTALTFHLKELEAAGLISSVRNGRFLLYSLKVDAMRELLEFLTEECCKGRPELCGSGIDIASQCKPKVKSK